MSLENLILDLINAVKENTKAVKQASLAKAEQPVIEPKAGDWVPQEENAEPTAETPTSETPDEDEILVSQDPDEQVVGVEQSTAEAPTTSEPVTDTPTTLDEVVSAMKQVLTKKGRTAVVTILDSFGVSKATELLPDDLSKAKQAFENELGA